MGCKDFYPCIYEDYHLFGLISIYYLFEESACYPHGAMVAFKPTGYNYPITQTTPFRIECAKNLSRIFHETHWLTLVRFPMRL